MLASNLRVLNFYYC